MKHPALCVIGVATLLVVWFAQLPAPDAAGMSPPVIPSAARPDIPQVLDNLYFGVPAGNGTHPERIAMDSRQRRVYTLNTGFDSLREGNTVSVYDMDRHVISALIQLDNMREYSAPDPLALQVDPYRPRLYALWGDRYSDTPDSTLTIIDTQSLAVLDSLPGVEAIAAGPDRLYLLNDSRLWTVDPESFRELQSQPLEPRKYNDVLRLNPQENRIYLGRGKPWSLEARQADTLTSQGVYNTRNELVQAIVDPGSGRLLVLEYDGEHPILRSLNADANLLARPAPVTLETTSGYDSPLALGEDTLYVGDGEYTKYRLRRFSLPDLKPLPGPAIRFAPNDMAWDAPSGQLYAIYTNFASTLQVIDPLNGPGEDIYIARYLQSALADPERGRLYLLDQAGTLRVLAINDYHEITRLETGFSVQDGYYPGNGQLALDADLHRLYISGGPVRSVDTRTFQVTSYPGLNGQLTPDPTSDRAYLTLPCNCHREYCNTLVLNTDTMTGTQTLFEQPEQILAAPCPEISQLDAPNQLLYVNQSNGTPGSNGGNYFSVFDVSGPPKNLYDEFDISYGDVALDPAHRRIFAPRYRMDRAFIDRFEARDHNITQSLSLSGSSGQLAYDADSDRLYAVSSSALQVFDGQLALLADIDLPGRYYDLLDLDTHNQRLYLKGVDGYLLVVATSGGHLPEPIPSAASGTVDYLAIKQMLAAPDDSLFRVYSGRAYRSDDDGRSWQLLGRGLPSRRLGALAISPNYRKDHTLMAGLGSETFIDGLYRSTDGGQTWLPTTRGLTDLEVYEIAFSPTFARDHTLFVSTRGQGLFRSVDGGDSWVSLAARYTSDEYQRSMSHVTMSPALAQDGLVLATHNDTLWRSADGGDSWEDTRLPGGLVAFSPNFVQDRLILVDGLWRSTDGGQTWAPSGDGIEPSEYGPIQLFFSPQFAADRTVYLVLDNGYDKPRILERSVDGGQSWQGLAGGLPDGFNIAAAVALPGGELWLSGPDGTSQITAPHLLRWSETLAAVPQPLDLESFDIQDVLVTPDLSLFVANSRAGVYKSVDGGHNWTALSFPVRADTTQTPHLALAGDGTLFAALGTAIERSRDDGQTWEYLAGAPLGFEVTALAVSPNFRADGVLVAGSSYSTRQLIRSADGGQTWQVVFDGKSLESASDIRAIAFSPNFAGDGTLYAWMQYAGLLRSTDGGLSWSLLTGDISQLFVQSMVVSPDGSQLYLGGLYGQNYVSADRGQTWLAWGDRVPDERVWSAPLLFDKQGTLLLGTDVGIYRSLDAGQTWLRASFGLPLDTESGKPLAVRAIVTDGGWLYAALVRGGLYVSDDQGASWFNAATGQPAAPTQAASPPPTPTPLPPTPMPAVTAPPPTPPAASSADCPVRPGFFAKLWGQRFGELGCPVASLKLTMVEQTFQGGWMFWRSDTRDIYVIPASAPYGRYQDSWEESQPSYSCADGNTPAQTPPTPQRGFGKVWCQAPLVRKLLGNATGEERAVTVTLQEFEGGLIFQIEQGDTFVLESRLNNWERIQ